MIKQDHHNKINMKHIINKTSSKIIIRVDMDLMDKKVIKTWVDSNQFFNKCFHKHLII
jgi:hypothetical protein